MAERNEYQFRYRHQYYAALAANLIMLGYGLSIGWFSPALPKLLAADSPLVDGPLSSNEISWIGSILNVGAMCGSFTFGFITAFLGCKKTMIFLAFPATMFWILIYFGDAYMYIFLARFFTGWTGGGIQTTIVLYISEISNNEVRGRLCSIPQLARNVGILTAYVAGAFVDYKYIPCIFIVVPLLYVVFFFGVPNTPQFYLLKQRVQKAQDALKYYKDFKGKSDAEIDAFNAEFERLKSIAQEQRTDPKLRFSDFTDSKAVKGLLIGIGLAYFSQLTGGMTIITYAVYIFERTGTTVDPYLASIALAVMLILGNLFTTQLADHFGRKTILITSLLGCAVGLTCLSIFLYLNKHGYDLKSYASIPIVCLAFVVFCASAGIVPLSHVCRVENLPTKIRTMGLAICVFTMNVTTFACTKWFPILLDSIDLHGCVSVFAVNCLIGMAFIYFILSETRGKPMDSLKSEQKQNAETEVY